VLAADGVFGPDGTFADLLPIPEALLEGGFRRAALDLLAGDRSSFRVRSVNGRSASCHRVARIPSIPTLTVHFYEEFASLGMSKARISRSNGALPTTRTGACQAWRRNW
jgi:hypothetical protein